jgi:hypothetical protein
MDRARARRAISWTTEIAHTYHRWWWYAVIIWAGWVVSLLLYAIGNPTGAILAAVATLGLIVINTGKPRTWKVTVGATSIRIERPDRPKFSYELPLDRYKSLTVVDMPAGNRDRAQKAIALLSKRRLGTAQLLVLPYDEHEADMIIQQFSDVIPYDADAAFSRSDRVLSAAVRWLGIG